MASLHLGVAALGESPSGDKGHPPVMRGQREGGARELPDCHDRRCGVQSGSDSPGHCALSAHSTSAKPRPARAWRSPGPLSLQQTSLTAGQEPHRNVSCFLGGNRHQDEMSPLGHPSVKVGLRAQPDPVEPSRGLVCVAASPTRQCRKPPWCGYGFQKCAGSRPGSSHGLAPTHCAVTVSHGGAGGINL